MTFFIAPFPGGGGSSFPGAGGGYETPAQIYVATNGVDSGKSLANAFNPSNPFLTLQAAFDFIATNAIATCDIIVRSGAYTGGALTLQSDFITGIAIIAEGRGVRITSTLTIAGLGVFEMVGVEIRTTTSEALILSPASSFAVAARLYGVNIFSTWSTGSADATSILTSNGAALEMDSGCQVQTQRTNTTTGTNNVNCIHATNASIVNVTGGRYVVFSSDANDNMSIIRQSAAALSGAAYLMVSSLRDLTNTNGAPSAAMSIFRCTGGAAQFSSSGGTQRYSISTASTEQIVPLWLDSAGVVEAVIASEAIRKTATPDVRTFAAAAAQATNAARLLSVAMVDYAALTKPARRLLGADAGSVDLWGIGEAANVLI